MIDFKGEVVKMKSGKNEKIFVLSSEEVTNNTIKVAGILISLEDKDSSMHANVYRTINIKNIEVCNKWETIDQISEWILNIITKMRES